MSFKGNPLLKFPEEITENAVKFEIGVTGSQYTPIGDFGSTRHKKIPYVDDKKCA